MSATSPRASCAVDPEGCPTYEANAEAYEAEIAALDKEVRAGIATVPESRRKVITTHDAFGYFAAGYGVAFLSPEGISTESEASAADVAALIDQIRTEHVTALFFENMSDPRLIEQIGKETGVTPGGDLFADALSERVPGGRNLPRHVQTQRRSARAGDEGAMSSALLDAGWCSRERDRAGTMMLGRGGAGSPRMDHDRRLEMGARSPPPLDSSRLTAPFSIGGQSKGDCQASPRPGHRA